MADVDPMSQERRAAIVSLLTSRDDGLPEPVRRDHSMPGFVHHTAVRESCPDCLTNDRRLNGCETCHGRGYVETLRERDPYAIDKVQPFGLDVTRHERARERDAQIARLAAQTREPFASPADELADANRNPYRWERERRRMWERFDYGQLDQALEAMRCEDEAAYRILHAVYVYRRWSEPSTAVEQIVERGLVFLHERLPDPLRAPGSAKPAALQRREKKFDKRMEAA